MALVCTYVGPATCTIKGSLISWQPDLECARFQIDEGQSSSPAAGVYKGAD